MSKGPYEPDTGEAGERTTVRQENRNPVDCRGARRRPTNC
jgi:hypothetical protein